MVCNRLSSSELAPIRKCSGEIQLPPMMVWDKVRYFLASSMVRMPPLALKPALRREEAMVSKMMLAASGVAETGVLPVEVLMKPTP